MRVEIVATKGTCLDMYRVREEMEEFRKRSFQEIFVKTRSNHFKVGLSLFFLR
jgi:hypothetical protein